MVQRKRLSEKSNDDCLLRHAFPCALSNVQLFLEFPFAFGQFLSFVNGNYLENPNLKDDDSGDYVCDCDNGYDFDCDYDDDESVEYLVVQLCPLEQMKTSLTPFHHSCACNRHDDDDGYDDNHYQYDDDPEEEEDNRRNQA